MKQVLVASCAVVCLMLAGGCNSGAGSAACVVSATTASPDGGTSDCNPGGIAGVPAVGVKPNGAHLSLDCRPYNVPGLTVHDCLYSHYNGAASTIDCTVKMADRNGLVIGTATPVSFRSEAGAMSPVAVSPAYDPSKPVSEQKALGHAVGFLEVYGSPLPQDVDPLPGEFSVVADQGCGIRTVNPRDGIVTVIAFVAGEEGYVDLNNNGKYDLGEPFIDEGEPYVDANDNGQWDPGEWFLDVNKDGQHTGPNGKWDADTILWTQARVVYTGHPAFGADASGNLFSRFFVLGTPPAASPPAPPFSVAVRATQTYGVFFTDENLNPMSAFTTYAVGSAVGNVNPVLIGPDIAIDTLGARFRLLYCDQPQAPATCFEGTADEACRTSPCYVVPDLARCSTGTCTGFVYGNTAEVIIKGVSVGSDLVEASTTQEGVTTSILLPGQCVAGP